MKTLDTDTVLEIINMIDNLNSKNVEDYNTTLMSPCSRRLRAYTVGKVKGLKELSDHLQEYIEGLVSQAENNLNAGE